MQDTKAMHLTACVLFLDVSSQQTSISCSAYEVGALAVDG